MKKQANHLILTGIPRAGTSLACTLLNQLPNTVALVEPLPGTIMQQLNNSPTDCKLIDTFFQETRKSLLLTGRAHSTQVAGKVPDNTADSGFAGKLLDRLELYMPVAKDLPLQKLRTRRAHAARASVQIDKELTDDFLLCIKHPISFTTILATLTSAYPCYALIRNPLAVLASWNTVPFQVREGRAKFAEQRDAELKQQLARSNDRYTRQIILLSWFFTQFIKFLPAEQIIRYEDVVATGGSALQPITSRASHLNQSLENKNQSHLYDHQLMQQLAMQLLETESACWHFYCKEEVVALVEALEQ